MRTYEIEKRDNELWELVVKKKTIVMVKERDICSAARRERRFHPRCKHLVNMKKAHEYKNRTSYKLYPTNAKWPQWAPQEQS